MPGVHARRIADRETDRAAVAGKPRVFMPYIGGVGAYRQKRDEVAASDFAGFRFLGAPAERRPRRRPPPPEARVRAAGSRPERFLCGRCAAMRLPMG
jgi:hypothetical protein